MLSSSLLRYAIVGVSGTLLDAVIFMLFHELWGVGYAMAATVAFGCAFSWNFTWNKIWTFGNPEGRTWRQFSKSLVVALGGLLITLFILWLSLDLLAIQSWVPEEYAAMMSLFSKLAASTVTFIWNFAGNKYWTFRERSIPLPLAEEKREGISIIIPMYNESHRIMRTLDLLQRDLPAVPGFREVLCVDDGSTDQTIEIVQRWQQGRDIPVRIIRTPHRGKGSAVREGLLEARGLLVLVMDADMATPLTEIGGLIPHMKPHVGMTMGDRFTEGSERIVRQSRGREGVGRGGNLLIRLIHDMPYSDTQCGFKLYRGEVGADIARLQKVDGFCYDVEHIMLIRMMGLKVQAVPVKWEHREGARIRVIWHALQMLYDLLLLKIWLWGGAYEKDKKYL